LASNNPFASIVDDEVDVANLFKQALSKINIVEPVAFSEPTLALEHFRLNYQRYTIVISDYRMPSMNDIRMLSKMRQINPKLKTMLITAFDVQDELMKDHECVDKFLMKPISVDNFISEVKRQINV
jgi:DNA-binding NtrC family response regulator